MHLDNLNIDASEAVPVGGLTDEALPRRSVVNRPGVVGLHKQFLTATALAEKPSGDALSIVDLFSGCGGLSIGVLEGARRRGLAADIGVAIDNEASPLAVLASSIGATSGRFETADLGNVLGPFHSRVSRLERDLLSVPGKSLLLAGPPCQGHSALNNHTRHDDIRNDLYVKVARAARILDPEAVVIENVRGVSRDKRGSFDRCILALEEHGYYVSDHRLNFFSIGVPQKRVRHLVVAAKKRAFEWSLPTLESRDVAWAIRDLLTVRGGTTFDTASTPNEDNAQRIAYLFQNGIYDLPNSERPVCHRSNHSYVSMYGRLRWREPAQTITSGFGSMGQGRFVHPLRPRTLTPHEAARLQFLPDFMAFGTDRARGDLARMIGNAVPPQVGAVLVELLMNQGLL